MTRAGSVRWPWAVSQPAEGQKQDTIVFASETCAFDLIGATYEREVKPGELVDRRSGRHQLALLRARRCRSRAASSSTSISRAQTAVSSDVRCRNQPRRVGPSNSRLRLRWKLTSLCRYPTPALLPHSVILSRVASPSASPDSQSLRRPHFHRAEPERARLRRKAQAEPGARLLEGKTRGADRRFHRARHYQP